ncbi:Hypothetical_protein [Hexamita inflata]|uniref:Hypothetical_protein n=1 Tax=Hexamita inflata TaxID=28002 RepID=A0AA86P0V7_9EUKA|nr:Hypothetical protein HINF_LOCUS16658 [Hexamita inflata]
MISKDIAKKQKHHQLWINKNSNINMYNYEKQQQVCDRLDIVQKPVYPQSNMNKIFNIKQQEKKQVISEDYTPKLPPLKVQKQNQIRCQEVIKQLDNFEDDSEKLSFVKKQNIIDLSTNYRDIANCFTRKNMKQLYLHYVEYQLQFML